MGFEIDFKKAVEEIKKRNAEKVLLQFPEGLKPEATKIASLIEKETDAEIFIWAGSCFGACDIPNLEGFLIIQFGHSKFKK